MSKRQWCYWSLKINESDNKKNGAKSSKKKSEDARLQTDGGSPFLFVAECVIQPGILDVSIQNSRTLRHSFSQQKASWYNSIMLSSVSWVEDNHNRNFLQTEVFTHLFSFDWGALHIHIFADYEKQSLRKTEMIPVERPFQQKLPGSFRKTRSAFIGLQCLHHHIVKPCSPLLQGALLLKSHLEVCFQSLNHVVITLAHPGSLLLEQYTESKRKVQFSIFSLNVTTQTICMNRKLQ